jgi:predicted PurR-regulated permease PerM
MTERDRIDHLIYYAAVILLGYLTYQVVQPFLMPLGWAGVLGICVQPIYQRLAARSGPSKAAALTTVLVLVVLVLPVWWIVLAIVDQAGQATDAMQSLSSPTMQLPAPIANAWRWMQDHVPNFGPDQLMTSVSEAAKRLVGTLASRSGAIIGGLAIVLLDLIITLFALFFVLRDSRGILRFIRAVLPFEEARRERVMHDIGDLIYASVIAGLAVAAMQGLLGGITFWILGLRAPVVWGTVMALFALIPVAGAWVVWLPVAIFLLVTGDVTRGIALFVVGIGVIGTVDNVLRPMLLSGRSSMNGLMTFVALLGGVAAFGFIGLVFGPVVVAITMAIFEPDEGRH